MVNVHKLWLCWLAAALLSCASDKKARTELILVADTNIANLDSIRFEVQGDGRTESEEAALRDDGEPLTLGLVLDQGSLGPLTVTARGIRNTRTVVQRSAIVSFVTGKTLVVALHLVASCESRSCTSSQTCSERGCEPSAIDAQDLAEWNGTPPELSAGFLADAGSSDAGAQDAALATCGVDRDVDLSSDVDNCGVCKNVCKVGGRNTVAACVAGECVVECRTLFGDCDSNESNGCEQTLTVNGQCGMCGVRCSTGSACLLGTCR